ncbi:hypothetical protein BASA50_001618 [Batrachochytrium salamandrivorans]|uniref:Protein kinase domain-containing protein n=1 Tax=Batrachochytrium salamandrivorans TaxID=1357716 RepID=A0ABQ8FNQ8_9FUNG|nr:hypothetical protein BASA60_010077 [Batrachochytrium salamandrivorans]KAH6601428.1 hypothetical protein BASA50_001618 [Batrachochytrium salamandrivorans]
MGRVVWGGLHPTERAFGPQLCIAGSSLTHFICSLTQHILFLSFSTPRLACIEHLIERPFAAAQDPISALATTLLTIQAISRAESPSFTSAFIMADQHHKFEDFCMTQKLGEGTFSEVLKVKHKGSGKIYAMKRFRKRFNSTFEEIQNLREIQALRRLNPHNHIIDLIETVFDQKHGLLALNFELMDCNLYELTSSKTTVITETKAKHYFYQICIGLEYMHSKGIFHRDIKPENILIKGSIIKLADFGSCRGIHSKQPYTEYIATRWYRSPECLLCDGMYSFKMDIWGAGCVLYEIISKAPLFPGSNELDQLHKIHAILGTPSNTLLQKMIGDRSSSPKYDFPSKEGTGIHALIPHISIECIDLINVMLVYDPDLRINAKEILQHGFFRNIQHTNDSSLNPDVITNSMPTLSAMTLKPNMTNNDTTIKDGGRTKPYLKKQGSKYDEIHTDTTPSIAVAEHAPIPVSLDAKATPHQHHLAEATITVEKEDLDKSENKESESVRTITISTAHSLAHVYPHELEDTHQSNHINAYGQSHHHLARPADRAPKSDTLQSQLSSHHLSLHAYPKPHHLHSVQMDSSDTMSVISTTSTNATSLTNATNAIVLSPSYYHRAKPHQQGDDRSGKISFVRARQSKKNMSVVYPMQVLDSRGSKRGSASHINLQRKVPGSWGQGANSVPNAISIKRLHQSKLPALAAGQSLPLKNASFELKSKVDPRAATLPMLNISSLATENRKDIAKNNKELIALPTLGSDPFNSVEIPLGCGTMEATLTTTLPRIKPHRSHH